MNSILEQLNESQREAVLYCDGPQLVIAGAGSGKTRVLTYKIAWLLQNGYQPWNILALTFTNKAAREMKERIASLVGKEKAMYLQMGTFHSVFARILRMEAHAMGYNNNFTIYDQSDSRSLVKSIIKEFGLDEKQYKAANIAERISMAKNHLLLPQAYSQSSWAHDDAMHKLPQVSNIYMRYAERCKQANAMDFDDLLLNIYLLFDNFEDIRQKYENRFLYVLVDEYQDTNYAQQKIVEQLTLNNRKICAVGDDAQSIYSFRGANIDNILRFNEIFKQAKLSKLEQNYRSTQYIVQAANSLIKHNEHQIPKDVYSKKEQGEKPTLKMAYSDKEEAMIVCKEIQRIKREEHCRYEDFAILYRTNSQSRSFEEYMRKASIPYRIYGGLSFFQRKEIKDVIAYYRVVSNHDDEEALKRIINYPSRGIGDTTIRKIVDAANLHGVSLWTVICQPMVFDLVINKGTTAKLAQFRTMIENWETRLQQEDAYELGHSIIMESGISKDIYSSNNPEDLSRQENLEEFLGGMKEFVDTRNEEDRESENKLNDFIQEVSLLTDLDSDDGDAEGDRVTLMTIHSAKGLEFPTVFIVGLEENIFPSPICANTIRGLEEERRLLYVAITRAEKHCILTCAKSRFRYGRVEMDSPSRFIKDIDSSLLNIDSDNGYRPTETSSRFYDRFSSRQNSHVTSYSTRIHVSPTPRNSNQLSSTPNRVVGRSDGAKLQEGCYIEHMRFGVGKVLKIEGEGENMKATVQFKNAGTKQLLLKFAKYNIIS